MSVHAVVLGDELLHLTVLVLHHVNRGLDRRQHLRLGVLDLEPAQDARELRGGGQDGPLEPQGLKRWGRNSVVRIRSRVRDRGKEVLEGGGGGEKQREQ